MRFASLLCLLLLARHAHAELTFRSTGRSVEIELEVDGTKHTCMTPCTLDVRPGDYRAKVDGLWRWLRTEEPNVVVVTPTRRGRMAVAGGILLAASTGLTFAGHWASPLNDQQRLSAGLFGGVALFWAIPWAISQSAYVGRTNSQADVYVGYHHAGTPMMVINTNLRRGWMGFGGDLGMRVSDDIDVYQLYAGPTFHFPSLPLVRPALAAHVGIGSRIGPTVIADPPIPGKPELVPVVDVQARLELTNPGVIQPSFTATYQALPDPIWILGGGIHIRL